jgi:hypothetical protein
MKYHEMPELDSGFSWYNRSVMSSRPAVRVFAACVVCLLIEMPAAGDRPTASGRIIVAEQTDLQMTIRRVDTKVTDDRMEYSIDFAHTGEERIQSLEWGMAILDSECKFVYGNVKTETRLGPWKPDDKDRRSVRVEVDLDSGQTAAASSGVQFFFIIGYVAADGTSVLADEAKVTRQLEALLEACGPTAGSGSVEAPDDQ